MWREFVDAARRRLQVVHVSFRYYSRTYGENPVEHACTLLGYTERGVRTDVTPARVLGFCRGKVAKR